MPCETPDIVSSCDSGEGSKRNSLELDTESFGILRLEKGNLLRERSWKRAMQISKIYLKLSSPGEMADSMTQSMASVSSLARDFSWEQLHTDTEREVMIMMVVMFMTMVMTVG